MSYAASDGTLKNGGILVSNTNAAAVVLDRKTSQGVKDSASNASVNNGFAVDSLAYTVIAGRHGVVDARHAMLGNMYGTAQARTSELLADTAGGMRGAR